MARSSLSRRLLFSLVPVAVLLGGAELGLRAAGWPDPDGSYTHNDVYWVTDPGLRGEAFPHPEEAATFSVSTDQQGLRAPLHPVDKEGGAHRIMTLGCSTTFGWGVDDEESYPAVLERLARAGGHARTEVINGGQPGYTSFQGRWLWGSVLDDYEPDVVLIGYVVQDARKAAYSDKSQAVLQQDARFLKDHFLYRFRSYLGLRSLLGGVQTRAKERGEGDEGGAYRVPPEDYADNLRALVAEVEEQGGQAVLFGYPLERSGYTADHRTILAAAATELGVPHLDLQDRMTEATRSQTLYFPKDRGHANADGNALIAKWVYAFLEEQGLAGAG